MRREKLNRYPDGMNNGGFVHCGKAWGKGLDAVLFCGETGDLRD